MDAVLQALQMVGTPTTIAVILLSSLFGLFVGAIPGLTATMATALLVPVTFFMDPVPAIAAIVACTAMAITAGDIPGCLLRIPGTPASAAYTDEAYAMTRKGQGELALGVSIMSSTIGGLFGFVVLAFTAPLLADVALQFSSFEYFWLAVLGLTSAAFISAGDRIKGVLSLLIGLFIATVGMDPLTGSARFTLGSEELAGGISFVPAMIGMFALSEIMRTAGTPFDAGGIAGRVTGNPFRGVGAALGTYKAGLVRGSLVGTVIGALPGAGGDIAAWISYAMSRRFSRTPERFGTGHVEGLVEAGASNNSALSAAWVPAMVFGIPGDAVTAIAIGVLYMKGMNPGPTLFTANPQNLYAVWTVFVIANLLMIPFGWLAVRAARGIFQVPRPHLMATILLFCIVGSFAINNTVFGVGIMLAMGVLAYALEANGFPIAPVILGIVMGPLIETNLLTSMMITQGDVLGLFSRPIAAVLGVATLAIWTIPLALMGMRALRNHPAVGRGRTGNRTRDA
ncbi:tripartite tricarboxylate transporter permease [Azospirillum sp. RWY-5-1]|uniref:Tripartite tricarboxylate transporter permease n=1 Tax=Azospirillum oleiclasticum TaxID=2735135 RepID=A0ABX2T9A1_9PROT|nr:tripartite tricarboxylate transporter permease [Azospirillum oleiclasticum]NYZ13942.1 tripartite tricarboxylate transporter permease [Azospirillum oleiclasticum]NYZ20865.1 tripartite tricarboxylate transporter permease [Azospirillum oleiclasticum]